MMLRPRRGALAVVSMLLTAPQSGAATINRVPARPAAFPTPITLSSAGRFPDIVVDEAGTSHIVWVTSDGVHADAVHYCRLKRGAGGCDNPAGSQVFVPQKTYGPGDGPQYNTSTDGARIVRVGGRIVILDYRYPTVYVKPDLSKQSSTVLEWVSQDGGNSFAGPAVVGDQPINGGALEFGPDNNSKILTITDTVSFGTFVQAITPGQYTSASGNLGTGGPDQAYYGSLALDRGLPVAAFADLSSHTLIRRWTGVGSPGDASTWAPAFVVPGDEPKLAGGPGGLFLMNRGASGGPYLVRRVSRGLAGPPTPVTPGGAAFRDFTETPGGRLLAGWVSHDSSSLGVNVRTSTDGRGWSGTERLIGGNYNGQLRLGAADDGGGVAVLNHTGLVSSTGQIVAIAFGTREPPPILGRSTNLAPVQGTARYEPPGGRRFLRLTDASHVPVGTIVDATHGKVTLTFALPGNHTETIVLYGGEFRIQGQSRSGLVTFVLVGPFHFVAGRALDTTLAALAASIAQATPIAVASRRRGTRSLWGSDSHGSFRTQGNAGAAAVRGTIWLTEDFIGYSRFYVAKGTIVVTDFRHHNRRIKLKAGHCYQTSTPRDCTPSPYERAGGP